MSNFSNNAITESGRLLFADVQAGAVLIPTKIVIGSGNLPAGKTPKTMTAVVAPVKELAINKKEKTPDGKAVFGGVYSNQGISEAFYFRELALYCRAEYRAEDGTITKSVAECLYSYGNAGATADYMPAYSTDTVVERQMDLVVYVGNDAKVDLTIDSGIWVTREDVETMVTEMLGNINLSEYAKVSALNAHINNKRNPHGVDVDQIDAANKGLTNVEVGPWFEKVPIYNSSRIAGIAYGDGVFVAIARDNGLTALISENGGKSFGSSRSQGDDITWRSVCYGGGKFVAITEYGAEAIYSEDGGETWNFATLPAYQSWGPVCYGGGKFIAMGFNTDKAAYSEDGITWRETNVIPRKYWASMAYGNGKFVAVAQDSNIVISSSDGISWTETTMEYGNNRNWNNICFGNGLFFTAADNSDVGAYSEDGRTWTQFTIPMPSDWKALGFCDDTFIAITRYGTVLYSPDLSNWKKVATRYDTSNVVGMAYGDGAIVVMGLSESAMRAEWKTPIIKLLDEINVRTANIVRTANVYAAAEVI